MTAEKSKRLIWDWPTRAFHWLLVLSISFQYVSIKYLDNATQWHFYVGYFTLGLLLFRILWGFVGPRYARFSQFSPSLQTLLAYCRKPWLTVGHNPLGALSVYAILITVTVQALTGLVMSDDIFLEGPYYHLVSKELQNTANWIHHRLFNLIIALIGLHLSAIAYYQLRKKQALIAAMLHGKKDTEETGIPHSNTLRALLLIMVCSLIIYALVEVLPPPPPLDFY